MASGASSSRKRKLEEKGRQNWKQLCLDFGQKRFGPIVCPHCNMAYNACNPDDLQDHEKFHHKDIRFPGWKAERIAAVTLKGRIIKVTSSDPKPHLKRINEIIDDVKNWSQVYLYIQQKKVVGYVVITEEEMAGECEGAASSSKNETAGAELELDMNVDVWVKDTLDDKRETETDMLEAVKLNFKEVQNTL